ncbi:MAG: hypothetical protein H6599_02075 [Flavobacteriales bacterium]|nr:hypothetical protein [Flavobacteriales bacterium]
MELYELKDLLLFWQRQMKDGFRVIEALVNLLEVKQISEEEKHKVILETLQRYGLFEVGYDGDRDNFLQGQSEIVDSVMNLTEDNDEIQWSKSPGDITVPMEIYVLKVLTGKATFTVILN